MPGRVRNDRKQMEGDRDSSRGSDRAIMCLNSGADVNQAFFM